MMRGLTLLELIIVMSIITLVTVSTGVNFPGYGLLRGEVHKFISTIKMAYHESVLKGKTVVLEVDSEVNTYVLIENAGQESEKRKLPAGIKISRMKISGHPELKKTGRIVFFPEGYSDSASVQFSDRKGRKLTVALSSIGGRVEIR